MNQPTTIAVFAGIYILVDLVYVWSSRGFYESRIKAIQGSGFPKEKGGLLLSAFTTYAAMAVGWAILVARQIRPETTYLQAWGYALVYAAIVHGVFNGTLYVMLDKWDFTAVLRDITWGVVWISVITFAYVGLRPLVR